MPSMNSTLTDPQRAFLESQHAAAMITIGDDGLPKVARVAVAVVDGKLWSSGTDSRVRTARLRRDPRCTVFVFEPGYRWLTLETTVRLIEGPDVPALSVRLFRIMQNRPTGALSWFGRDLSEQEMLQAMAAEKRVIYEFDIAHAYGMV